MKTAHVMNILINLGYKMEHINTIIEGGLKYDQSSN